jgi:hypothetical protein
MQNPAPTARQVTVEEAIEELNDILAVIVRSFSPAAQEHIAEQLEARTAERRRARQRQHAS